MKDMKMQYEAPELAELKVIDFVLADTGSSYGGLPPGAPGENPFN